MVLELGGWELGVDGFVVLGVVSSEILRDTQKYLLAILL
jgi:hypothetical protein